MPFYVEDPGRGIVGRHGSSASGASYSGHQSMDWTTNANALGGSTGFAGSAGVAGTLGTGRAQAESPRLASAFLRRYSVLLERIAEESPAEVLEDALSATNDVAGLLGILAEIGLSLAPPAPDPLAAARARGVEAQVELLFRAGGAYRVGEVAERLGVSPQAVQARRQRGTILAVPQPNGEHLYPACQVGEDGVLRGLPRVLRAFQVDDAWTRLAVLLSPVEGLGGRTPLEMLAEGDVASAVEAVSGYGEHLG